MWHNYSQNFVIEMIEFDLGFKLEQRAFMVVSLINHGAHDEYHAGEGGGRLAESGRRDDLPVDVLHWLASAHDPGRVVRDGEKEARAQRGVHQGSRWRAGLSHRLTGDCAKGVSSIDAIFFGQFTRWPFCLFLASKSAEIPASTGFEMGAVFGQEGVNSIPALAEVQTANPANLGLHSVLGRDYPQGKQRKETGLARETLISVASAKASPAVALARTSRGVGISGKKKGSEIIRALQLVEAAGIEPASASPLQTVLHT